MGAGARPGGGSASRRAVPALRSGAGLEMCAPTPDLPRQPGRASARPGHPWARSAFPQLRFSLQERKGIYFPTEEQGEKGGAPAHLRSES